MILTVTPNPCVDKTVFIARLEPGGRFRSPKCTHIPGGKGTNVSRAVKALGGDTAALVIVGGHTGRHVVEMIEQQDGVRCVPVWVAGLPPLLPRPASCLPVVSWDGMGGWWLQLRNRRR